MKNFCLTVIALLCCITASAQWGGEYGVNPVPMGTSDYGNEYVIGADGTIWYFYYHPGLGHYYMMLQAVDKNGNKKFGEAGKVVSSYENLSYTVVNQYLYANSDSTVTVVISDLRNSDLTSRFRTYTAYRFRPDGTSVWDEDGVSIDGGLQADYAACMTFCELSDGSTAFAWQHANGDGNAIEIQKLSKDGKTQYSLDDTRLAKTNGYYVYPYMVPSDNGSFILVYGYTSSYYLRAMKYNADGTKAWASEARIYSGGWGSVMSLQSRMKVFPGPDDGVIVTWNDDSKGNGYYSPYLAYVKKDGSFAYTNADGKAPMCLSYEELSAYPPKAVFDKEGNIYAIFNQFNQGSQEWEQVTIQKVNDNGENVYGDNGAQIVPYGDHSLGNVSIQLGKEGQIGCFWELFYDYHNVTNYLSLRNASDGSAIDEDVPNVCWRDSKHYRVSLDSYYNKTDDTWLLTWEDDSVSCSTDSQTKYNCMAKFNLDGTEVITSGFMTDVNGDGNTDISDVNAVIAVICGNTANNEADASNEADVNNKADVNGDGTVDISDVNAIIAAICGE